MSVRRSCLWVLRVAKGLVGVGFVAVFVYMAWQGLMSHVAGSSAFNLPADIGPFLISLTGFVLWVLLVELTWEWVFRKTCVAGCSIGWRQSGFAFFKSTLARYVPGRVWYVIVLTETLVEAGVSRGDTMRSVLFEEVHYFAATVVFALVISPFLLSSSVEGLKPESLLSLLGIAGVGLIVWLFYPARLFSWVNRMLLVIFPKWKVEPLILRGQIFHWQVAFALFLLLVTSQGCILYPVVNNLIGPFHKLSISNWIVVLGAYPIARLVGQISSVSPGGLGVREGAYALMVLSVLDSDVSSRIAVWARMLSITAETVVFFSFAALQYVGPGLERGQGS